MHQKYITAFTIITAFMRDDLSSQQLHLGIRLWDKCTMRNMEVEWKSFVASSLENIHK